jgi:hypothetical protein
MYRFLSAKSSEKFNLNYLMAFWNRLFSSRIAKFKDVALQYIRMPNPTSSLLYDNQNFIREVECIRLVDSDATLEMKYRS